MLKLTFITALIPNDFHAIWLYLHGQRGMVREKSISGVYITSRKSEGRIEPILEWRGCLRSVSDEVRALLQVTELCNTGYRILTAWMPSRTRSMPLKDDRANPNQFPVKSAALRGRGGSPSHVGLGSSVTCWMRRSTNYLIGWEAKKVICMPLFLIKLPFSPQDDQMKSDASSIICTNAFHISHTFKDKIDLVHPFPGLAGTAGSELQREAIVSELGAVLSEDSSVQWQKDDWTKLELCVYVCRTW